MMLFSIVCPSLLPSRLLLLGGVFGGPVGMDGEVGRLLALTGGEHASLGRAFLRGGAGPPVARSVAGGRRLFVARRPAKKVHNNCIDISQPCNYKSRCGKHLSCLDI